MKKRKAFLPASVNRLRLHWAIPFLMLVLIFSGLHCQPKLGVEDKYGILVKKLEVLSRIRISLLKSVDAEKSAVMADTDQASQAFADQSLQAAETLEKDRREMALLIQKDPSDQEVKLLQEFDGCWTESRKIDRQILDFAVQNTNLKAARLSFGPGHAALKRLEKTLESLPSAGPPTAEESQVAGLRCRALTAGWKILYLQAPHIASANDQEMDKIETVISQNEEEVKNSLVKLKRILPETQQGSFREAEAAFTELVAITARVIDLSRRNTNIKSFELSLGRKRKITAQCDEILMSLQEVVQSRSFKATR
jgi:hypothetical protein